MQTHWLCNSNFLFYITFHPVGWQFVGVWEDSITIWCYMSEFWLNHKSYVKFDRQDLFSVQPHGLALVNFHLSFFRCFSPLYPLHDIELAWCQPNLSSLSWLCSMEEPDIPWFWGDWNFWEGLSCCGILPCLQDAVKHLETLFLQIIWFASEHQQVIPQSCRAKFKWVHFFSKMARSIWFSWKQIL